MRFNVVGITVLALTLSLRAASRLAGSVPAAPLPLLGAPLVLDGALDEWEGTAAVPLLAAQDVVRRTPVRLWTGPNEFGAEFRLAWTPQGLCVAAMVADSQVVVGSAASDLVEVFLDARLPSTLGSDPPGPGVVHAAVRAPEGAAPAIFFPAGQALPGEIKTAGRIDKERHVWTLELLIPWPETFAARAGSKLGLDVVVVDFDPGDEPESRPMMLARRGNERFRHSPAMLARWELVERLSFGPACHAGPMLDVDAPVVIADPSVRVMAVYLSGTFAAKVSAVRLAVRDSVGKALYDKVSRPVPLEMPWSGCAVARFPFDTRYGRDGRQVLEVQAIDESGVVLGTNRLGMVAESRRLQRLQERLRGAAPVRGISGALRRGQEYLAAAAAFERYRAAVRTADTARMGACAAETDVRLAALEKRPLVESTANTLYDLLRFSRPPEVLVKFDGPRTAHLSLYCGAVPLAVATVCLHESKVAAMNALRRDAGGAPVPSRDTLVAGQAAAIVECRLRHDENWDIRAFDPSRHVSLVRPGRLTVSYDISDIGTAFAEAGASAARVVILPNCPDTSSAAVQAWARRSKRRIVPLDSIAADSLFVLAGDIRDSSVAARIAVSRHSFVSYVPDAYRLAVCAGHRSYVSSSASPEVARRVVVLLLANMGISEEDVEGVRQMLVRALCPPGIKPAAPTLDSLFCGDVHIGVSDILGAPSPEGVLLQALYANHDFAVLCDRNTVERARQGRQAAVLSRLAFRAIVGQETVSDSAVLVIYPLSQRITPTVPLLAVVEAARTHGALVQACVDGALSGSWRQGLSSEGETTSGIDLYEHIPARYDEWAAGGKLPPLVGSNSTHTGLLAGPERTVVFAIDRSEAKIVQALRENRCAIVNASSPRYFYGPAALIRPFWAALAEGTALRRQKTALLRNALWDADLQGFIAGASGR